MSLHLSPLIERERTGLLEQSGRQPDLSDVVDEAAEVGQLDLFIPKRHPVSDVPSVNSNRSRMTSRVPVSRVKRCD